MKNIYSLSGLILTGILAMSSCKVSKDVDTPQELPANYRGYEAGDTTSLGQIPWKTFFQDPALQQLIDSAIAHNYDLQIAIKNIEATDVLYKQSKLGYYPDVRLNVSAATNRPSDNSLNGITASAFLGTTHIEDYNAAVALSWEADIWGKIKNRKKRALADYLQTAEARKAIQTRLVASVAQGYYNLIMLHEQLRIAQSNLALNDSTLQMVKLQYTSGLVTQLAVQQAASQQMVAAQLVPQMEQNIAIQENALSILSGRLPAAITVSAQAWEKNQFANTTAAGIPSQMVSLRPDVRQAELGLMAANADVAVAKASLYPALTITASGGVNTFTASNWFTIPASLFGTAAGGLTQPLFQRGALKAQYKVAKVQREQSVLQFRQTVLTAVGEVTDALVKIDKLSSQQRIAADRATTLKQATSNANMLFSSGMATYLEVITAQANVLQTELELASIQRNQLYAVVDLYRSLGGGWQ